MRSSNLRHIALIQDGNRRWAESKGMLLWEGHKFGVAKFLEAAKWAVTYGIPYITFWALSIDNILKRDKKEISFLYTYTKSELEKPETLAFFLEHGIQLSVIGKWEEMVDDKGLKKVIKDLEAKTRQGKKHHLTVLFAYDGKVEMIEAIKKLEGKEINPEELKESLWTGFLPEVDLVIRTGGEPHWSAGFMMWLVANSQLYFTDTKWPDLTKAEFDKTLSGYSKINRRLGK